MDFLELDSLENVLAQPTQMRSEMEEPATTNFNDFSNVEFEEEQEEEEQEEEQPNKPPRNPVEEAEKLMALVEGGNILISLPIAKHKSKRKFGGAQHIAKMEIVASKQNAGQKLNEAEQKMYAQYLAYLQDKERRTKGVMYTEEEIKGLTKIAIPMMKESKMRINGAMTFFVSLLAIQGSKIMTALED